jgi:hypothetical protein
MAASRAGLFGAFWDDGLRYLRVIAPLASIVFTVLKALEFPVHLKDWSYAWALLPLLIWVVVAYVRRWIDSERLEGLIESKVTLGFDAIKCIRDVHFERGMSRYVSVTVCGQDNISVPNVSVYLHSIEYIDESGEIERIDIEGSPQLEWAQSTGPVHAHDPRSLHAGREALINILFCTDTRFPAEIFMCSPARLLREQSAMSVEGTYRVVVRASGDGSGRFAEKVLRLNWDGVDPGSLKAETWPTENI